MDASLKFLDHYMVSTKEEFHSRFCGYYKIKVPLSMFYPTLIIFSTFISHLLSFAFQPLKFTLYISLLHCHMLYSITFPHPGSISTFMAEIYPLFVNVTILSFDDLHIHCVSSEPVISCPESITLFHNLYMQCCNFLLISLYIAPEM